MRFLLNVSLVTAYGRLGHWLSGRIAMDFLTAQGKEYINKLLPEYKGRLDNACTWADEIKSIPSFRWASPLHYLDPENDYPPSKCSYSPSTDDGSQFNAVGAIFNFTNQITANNSIKVKNMALKFLVHIVGDLHQPLHVTGRDRGGI